MRSNQQGTFTMQRKVLVMYHGVGWGFMDSPCLAVDQVVVIDDPLPDTDQQLSHAPCGHPPTPKKSTCRKTM